MIAPYLPGPITAWHAEYRAWTDQTIFGPILVFPSPLVGKWFPKHGGVW